MPGVCKFASCCHACSIDWQPCDNCQTGRRCHLCGHCDTCYHCGVCLLRNDIRRILKIFGKTLANTPEFHCFHETEARFMMHAMAQLLEDLLQCGFQYFRSLSEATAGVSHFTGMLSIDIMTFNQHHLTYDKTKWVNEHTKLVNAIKKFSNIIAPLRSGGADSPHVNQL